MASAQRTTGLGLALLAVVGLATSCRGQEDPADPSDGGGRPPLEAWIRGQRKPRGGFGPPGAVAGDLLWTARALRCLELLGAAPDPDLLATLELAGEERDLVLSERLARHAVRSALGGGRAEATAPPFAVPPLTSWTGSPPLSELEDAVRWRRTIGKPLTPAELGLLRAYLGVWRAPDGGWSWPASLDEAFAAVRAQRDLRALPEGGPRPSTAGAIAAAVAALRLAEQEVPEAAAAIRRLEGLRVDGGGFRSGDPRTPDADLWATWNALRSLAALGALPRDRDALVAWIAGHRHRSGAFAHGAEDPPSLEATWLALESLALLGATLPDTPAEAWSGALPPASDPGELQLFEALVEVGPDPGVVVGLAAELGADLVLLKGHPDETPLAERARRIARSRGLAIAVACAREEHLRAWGEAGIGYVTHCSDVLYPPGLELTPRAQHPAFAAMARTWETDRARGALVFSCSHAHRELLTPAYLASQEEGAGYDALMVGWAFAPGGNVVARWPWLHRWVGRLPVIGNHDAHGDPFHWWHRGLRSRTFFFAKQADLDGFRDAVRRNRVVVLCGRGPTEAVFGHPHWVAALRARREAIRWPASRTEGAWLPRPLAIPIDAASRAELPALVEGHGLVVRAAPGLGDDALPFEVDCTVDGRTVPLRLAPPGGATRPVLWAPLPGLRPGDHEVVLSGVLGTRRQTLRFGDPVVGDAEPSRIPGWTAPPSALDLDDPSQLPWVHTPVAPGDLRGTVRIRARRADFLLTRPAGAEIGLLVTLRGGAAAGPLHLFVNGHEVARHVPDGGATVLRHAVPRAALRAGAQRITLRTALPGWLPSFPLTPSDLEIDALALVADGEDGR